MRNSWRKQRNGQLSRTLAWKGHHLCAFNDVQTHVNCWVANALGIETGQLPHLLAGALPSINRTIDR